MNAIMTRREVVNDSIISRFGMALTTKGQCKHFQISSQLHHGFC